MKIIKEGNKPEPAWWVGELVVCGQCKLEGVLEEGDNVCEEISITKISIYTHCPACGNLLQTYRPR